MPDKVEEIIPPTPPLAEVEFAVPRGKQDGMWLNVQFGQYFVRGNFGFVSNGCIGIQRNSITLQGQRSASCAQVMVAAALTLFVVIFCIFVIIIGMPWLILPVIIGLYWMSTQKFFHATLSLNRSSISELDYDGKRAIQFRATKGRWDSQRCRITARTRAEAAFIIYHLSANWPETAIEKPAVNLLKD